MVDDKAKPKEDTTIVEFQACKNNIYIRTRVKLQLAQTCGLHERSLSLCLVCRGYLARKKYKELVDEKNKAATKIQAHFKGHKQRKSFQRRKYANSFNCDSKYSTDSIHLTRCTVSF